MASPSIAPAPLQAMHYEDGSVFYPEQRVHPGATPFEDQNDDGTIREWTSEEKVAFGSALWTIMFEAKRAEIERLKRNSLYYDGFHYADPRENRQNAITNRCFQLVEAQVAAATAEVPRPEIVGHGDALSEAVAARIQKFAEFIEDTDNFDDAVLLGAVDKFIYGYNVWAISFDFESGMPYVKNISVFDWYWDPAARNEDEMAYCAIAMPYSTHRLRALYPEMADQIVPDKVASPAWEITSHPWRGFVESPTTPFENPLMPNVALAVHEEGENPTEGVALVVTPGQEREWGHSTFFVQLYIRDEVLCDVQYIGTLIGEDGTRAENQTVYNSEPRCDSGWWCMTMTATGVLLDDAYQVDPCFLGLPIVVDRNRQRTDRYESLAELDQIIPIQRGLNRRKRLMMRALEISANPPAKAMNGGLVASEAQRASIGAGEIIQIARGGDLAWMEYNGPSQQQFEMLGQDANDMESIAGSPDVQRGVRPAGIEAASAIQELDDNSMRRMNSKEPAAHRARARLVRKILYCAGKKLQPQITFIATDGQPSYVTGEELCSQYRVRYARGSGMPDGKRDRQQTALLLAQGGFLDQQEVLDVFNWPGRDQIVARMTVQKLQELQVQAEAAARAGPPGGGSEKPVDSGAAAA